MKILTIPSWYRAFPGSNDGNLFRMLAAAFAQKGFESEILFAGIDWRDFPEKWKYPFKELFQRQEEGVLTYRYNTFFLPKRHPWILKKWIAAYVRIFERYLMLTQRPDLIHAHSYLAALVAQRIKDRHRIPYILSEHSSAITEKKIPQWLKPYLRGCYQEAGAITAVSKKLASELGDQFQVEAQLIPNGVDTEIFYPVESLKKSETVTFLSIGAPSKVKGYAELIQAFAGLNQNFPGKVKLLLGDHLPDQKKLKRQARKAGLTHNNLIFPGSMTLGEVAEQMRSCDVYVSASHYETFGMTLIEAMACGKPIITTATDGPKDFFDSRAGVMVPLHDLSALQEALHNLYRTHKQYDPAEIRSLVVPRYSYENIIREYGELFNKILRNY